ncbi:uncharacterized protein LOC105633799 isoform X2 [Jatropha curcas]|uniref:uncharacterized protein LOC105633799 isoform X2 n=1 Tax=Jatropha curcas TaxID=180498 RepID=UPI00189589ED|nr:uncharacterized protein LOC105633799 isoform X2 [Jatropha curcas]XP_037497621.1 uncharacterized protein LOC105633799 isoform X2 [Jatropha curcas]
MNSPSLVFFQTADIDEKCIRKEKPEELVMALAEAKADAILSKLRADNNQENDGELSILIAADTAEAILQRLSVHDYIKDAVPALLITCDQFFFHTFQDCKKSPCHVNWLLICASSENLASQNTTHNQERDLITKVVVYEGSIREKPSSEEEARQFLKGYSGGHAATVSSVLVTNLKTGFRKVEWDRVEIYFHEIPDEVIEKLIEEGLVLRVAGGLIIEHPLILPYVKEVVGTTDSVMGLPKALTEKLMKEAL